MRKDVRRDIIDKVFDRIVKGEGMQGFFPYKEVTYVSIPEIAERLGCSQSTIDRMIRKKILMVYPKIRGRRTYVATNETLLRMTFHAWCQVTAKPVP